MKKRTRIILFALVISMLASLMAVGVFAAEGTETDLKTQNVEYGREKKNLLEARIYDHYYKKPGNLVSAETATAEVILEYERSIDKLLIDENLVDSEDLTDEIDLVYHKGIAAGILSWIYYSHEDTESDSDVAAVYEAQLKEINSKTTLDDFLPTDGKQPRIEDCYTLLLQSIYSKRIAALAAEGDSKEVADLISSAPTKMGSQCGYDDINSDGEDCSNYKSFYEQVKTEVETQRNRDKTKAQMIAVLGKLYPDENYDTTVLLINFRNSLTTKARISDMNTLLSNTIVGTASADGLLDMLCVDGSEFRNAYLDERAEAVLDTVRAANESDPIEIADVAALFTDYSLELYAADKKDELDAYVAKVIADKNYPNDRADSLRKLADEYTDVGGCMDLCANESEIDAELERAKARCDWFCIYCDTVDGINGYSGDNTKPLADAQALYAETDTAIKDGERDGTGSSSDRLADDIEKMGAFVIDAEVIEFETDHKAIIDKETVNADDRAAISNAIADANGLSDGAETILADTLIALGEKYKAACADAVNSYREDDAAKAERNAAAERLTALIEELSAKDKNGSFDLPALKERADSVVNKAAELDSVMDTYSDEYLAGEGREFAEEASGAVSKAADGIILAADGSEAEKKSDAIEELLQLTALERIYGEGEGKNNVPGVPALLEKAKTEIKALSDKNEINAYADGKIAEIRELVRLDEIAKAKSELDDICSEMTKTVEDYGFISENDRTDYLSDINSEKTRAFTALENAADAEKVKEELERSKAELEKIRKAAADSEKSACLADARSALDAVKETKDDYSAQNYAEILEIIDEYKNMLAKAESVANIVAIRDEALSLIGAVEDLLEAAKRLAKEKLTAEYERLMQSSDRYSNENLARLTEIYEHSIAEVDTFSKISDAAEMDTFANERIALMRGVYLDVIYTSDRIFADGSSPVRPDGYSPETDGYAGSVFSSGGITHDMTLTVVGAEESPALDALKKAIKDKKLSMSDGTAVNSKTLRALKNCKITLAVDIGVGIAETVAGKEYTVSLLLPEDMDMSNIIGVIFISEDGSVKFHEITVGDTSVDFTTDHFSTYYIVSRGEVNLIPWIICLSILVFCELGVIAILIIRRRRRMAEGALYSVAVPTALSVIYKPVGGVAIVAVLGVTAVALAFLIGYLVYLEIKAARAKRAADAVIEEPVEAPVPVTPEAEPAHEAEPEEISVPTVQSVTVEEAEELMSDETAIELQEEIQKQDYVDTEIYKGAKKAEINIDTICASFEDGETVTLNSMKEKKLLGASVGHVKVLARGRLDRSLTVVAQDFSAAAVKMILLTGGKAIKTHQSRERSSGGKKR